MYSTTANKIEEDLSVVSESAPSPFTPEYIYTDMRRYRRIMSFELKRLQQSNSSLLQRYFNTDGSLLPASGQRRYHLRQRNNLPSLDIRRPRSKNSFKLDVHRDRHLTYDIPDLSTIAYQTDYLQHSTGLVRFYFTTLADYTTSFTSFTELDSQRFTFLSQHQILTKMTLPAHGTTTGVITNFISGELTQMGIKVDEELKAFNNQTITSDDGNESKEADQAWGPFTSPPEYPATKPTVVLEVGLSETADKLKNDALFWLNPKKGAANMVITCKIDRGTPFIMLEKWERPNPKGRIQVTEVVVIAQKTLTRAEKANTSIEEQMELSKTALTIPLFTLFRRDPVQGQTDIVFDEGMLKNLARRAWEEQGFLTTGS